MGRVLSSRWGDLRLRVISASVLAPVALACMWAGGLAFVLLVAGGRRGHGGRMGGHVPPGPGRAGRLARGAALCRARGLLALLWLRADPAAGRGNVLFVVAVVWASDIGAYAAGRLVGGPKLAPAISPGKTWSGAAGGLVAVLLVAWAFAGTAIPPGRGMLVAACLGVASQAGDLLESAIKRGFGVKDSGRLIPGHGGLLDRIDGLIAAAPLAAVLAGWTGRGVGLWQ